MFDIAQQDKKIRTAVVNAAEQPLQTRAAVARDVYAAACIPRLSTEVEIGDDKNTLRILNEQRRPVTYKEWLHIFQSSFKWPFVGI